MLQLVLQSFLNILVNILVNHGEKSKGNKGISKVNRKETGNTRTLKIHVTETETDLKHYKAAFFICLFVCF